MSDVLFFRAAFLRHTPQRYALTLMLAEARRLDQKYDERRRSITDAMIARRRAGPIVRAVPAAVGRNTHLLPLDVGAGASSTIRTLIATATQRGLSAFQQYGSRTGLSAQDQRGYVWLAFVEPKAAGRLQLLGEQLIRVLQQGGWKIEVRMHAAVTRLPVARYARTGSFSDLTRADQAIAMGSHAAGVFAELRRRYCENPVRSFPLYRLIPSSASRGRRCRDESH